MTTKVKSAVHGGRRLLSRGQSEPVVIVDKDTNRDGYVVVTVDTGKGTIKYRVPVEPLDVSA